MAKCGQKNMVVINHQAPMIQSLYHAYICQKWHFYGKTERQ